MPNHPLDGEMLRGTLDLLILQTLAVGAAHGHTIAHVIERRSDEVLQVEHGSLYPALHRLEDRGWIASFQGTRRTIEKPGITGSRRTDVNSSRRRRSVDEAGGRGQSRTASGGGIMFWLGFFPHRRRHEERQREIQEYLDLETDENIARGLHPKEARETATENLAIGPWSRSLPDEPHEYV